MNNAGVIRVIGILKDLENRPETGLRISDSEELGRVLNGVRDAKLMLEAIALTIGNKQ